MRAVLLIGLLACGSTAPADKPNTPSGSAAPIALAPADAAPSPVALQADALDLEVATIVVRLGRDVEELATRLAAQRAAIDAAQSDEDRANARAAFETSERDRLAMLARIAPARATISTAARTATQLALNARDPETERATNAANHEIHDNQERLDMFERSLVELAPDIARAIDTIVQAQNDVDRARAKARLDELRREQAKLKRRKP